MLSFLGHYSYVSYRVRISVGGKMSFFNQSYRWGEGIIAAGKGGWGMALLEGGGGGVAVG